MINGKKVITIIPARGGSKGIPGKNKRIFIDKPLISWSIEHALKINIIDEIIVTTDDEELIDISKLYDVKIVKRPKYLSKDNSLVIDAVRHALNKYYKNNYNNEILLMLEPTSPFRRKSDTISCIEMVSSENTIFNSASTFRDAMLHPCRAWKMNNSLSIQTYINDSKPWLNRQDLPNAYQPTGTYVFKAIPEMKNFVLSGTIGAVIVPSKYCIDLDEEYDWFIGEIIMKELLKNGK